jgi:hypothetical protein
LLPKQKHPALCPHTILIIKSQQQGHEAKNKRTSSKKRGAQMPYSKVTCNIKRKADIQNQNIPHPQEKPMN